jgi:hypothetical protein
MGIEFKLSDRELPASPAFIRFLDGALSGKDPAPEVWPDQLSEQLAQGKAEEPKLVAEAADRVMRDAVGRECVARAYTLFVALLTGDTDSFATFGSRFHFISVIGVPRTGGSYLTAELYRSLGIDPYQVPGALAHDSFPEAGPFELARGFNSWTVTLKTTAEYLAMVEMFFEDRGKHLGKTVVPKKLTQGVYAAGLFGRVFGPESDCVLTIRHPAAACVSTYEKSGGLPEDGRLRVRSNIERWCRRDLQHAGWDEGQLETMDYFEAYLRYWELYHLLVATAGLSRPCKLRVVPYGAAHMQSLAQQYHDAHGSPAHPSIFQGSDRAKQRHPDWVEKARPALERVRSAWSAVGLVFPADEIARCE